MAQPIETGRLYDHTGTLVPLSAPPPRIAEPPDGVEPNVQDRFREYFKDLSPRRIVSATEAADAGYPFEWIQLCEELIEKDPKLASVLATRTKAVLGLDHEVRSSLLDDAHVGDQALADEIARFCDGAVDDAGLSELVGDLMDSIAKPLAVDWISWGTSAEGKIVPQRFDRIPPTHLRWGVTSDSIRVWNPSNPQTGPGGDVGIPFEPFTTVRALNNERRDHPARSGLMRSIAWYELFKKQSIKDWVSLADRFGTPRDLLILDDDDFKDPALYKKARAEVNRIGTQMRGVISDKWKLETMVAGAKGGADLMAGIVVYIDKAIAQLVLGHELTSQGSAGGGMLGISAAIQVRQDILESDCNFLSSVIRRDLLTPMVGWNFGWENIRLVPYSVFHFEPPKDKAAEANVLATIAKTFPIELSMQQLRDEYNLDEPLTPEDAISANKPTPSPFGGGQQPGQPGANPEPPPVPGQPAVVNGAMSAISRVSKRRTVTRPSARRMSKVDQVAARAAAAVTTQTEKWKAQLRTMIREATKEGLTLPELKNRIVAAYPDLDASATEKILHEQMLLVRLFGRNG